jgi:hypothetical protein
MYGDCWQEAYEWHMWIGVKSVRVMCTRLPLHDLHQFELSRLSDMSNRLSYGRQRVDNLMELTVITYISMTHYKSLILVLATCKYTTSSHLMPCHLSPLKNISKNSSSMPHHTFSLKNKFKYSGKLPHMTSPFSIEK